METWRASPPTATTATINSIVLGKYKLGCLLGKGSFAKVYHAFPLKSNQTESNRASCPNHLDSPVAIKIIEKPKTSELASAMEPRILHEIHAMQRLKPHPNILKIHEVMATKSKIYLVMDLAPCGDLQTKLSKRGRFSESTARKYFEQLISALHFCHQNGVAHRDIKPQNLLLDHHEKTLKISDFGLSALPDFNSDKVLLRTACGTPAYAAPEVFRRGGADGYDGTRADAWSCGVILFLLLSGHLPFDDSNLAIMYKQICRREYKFPNWVSGRARSIISQLLDPNPNTRMTIEALMGHVWFRKSMSLPAHFKLEPIDKSNKFGKEESSMNAFDIISMSSGLDLSGLFEKKGCGERERRFTAKGTVEAVEERVEEVGGRLGYCVERDLGVGGKGFGLLLKGRVVLVFEILVVAPEFVMVVVKVVEGGFGGVQVEVEGVHWEELRVGFEGLALSWHNDGN